MIELDFDANADGAPVDLDVDLDGETYRLRFLWNDRIEAWTLDVFGSDGTIRAASLAVRSGFPINAALRSVAGLPAGILIALARDSDGSDPGLADLGARVRVVYLTAAETATA